MKQIGYILFLVFLNINLLAQNTIQDVYNNVKEGNLEQAKKGIDYLSGLSENAENSTIWYYKAVVYHSIYENKDSKINQLHQDALLEAYNAYLKTIKYDLKKEYLTDVIGRLEIAAISFFNKGVDEFSAKRFSKAFDAFECAIAINEMPMINKIDTVIFLNAAISAENSGKIEKAETYYQKMIDLDYGGVKIYQSLAELYQNNGKDEQFTSLLKNGISKFPGENVKLLVKLINYYMGKGQKDKALDYLEMAIKNDPNNSIYYFVKGSIFDQLEDYNNAAINYRKSLELDDKYFDANYNLGVIFYNKGIDHIKKADENMNSNKIYEEEKKLAENQFSEALPYLEKAHAIREDDKNTQQTLIVIYNRLQMKEKFELMKKKFAE